MRDENKTPVICCAKSSENAFHIFNANDWTGKSKAIIQSCITELSIIHYEYNIINEICKNPKKLCNDHFENIKRSSGNSNDLIDKAIFYAQIPEIHVFIKAFFASLKGLLDLIVQLLSTEKIVNTELDGFHRKKNIYGATVLNALLNNSCSNKKEIAENINNLIENHKKQWIDKVIEARDLLVHPIEGVHQIMFLMEIENHKDSLILKSVVPPHIGSQPIDNFIKFQVNNIENFCKEFLNIISMKSG